MMRRAFVLAGLLALWPAPASAAAAPAVPARISHVVAAWKTSPVFVDPLDDDELSQPEASTLAQTLAHTDPPLFVAVMPADSNDDSAGSSDSLLYSLYQANGRKGIYVLVDPYGSIDYQAYGYLPGYGDGDAVDSGSSGDISARLTQLTRTLLAGAEPDPDPVRAPAGYGAGRGSPTGTVIGSAFGGVALGIAGYWLIVFLVGLLRLATGRPFRWSHAATGRALSRPTARRHG